jgi:hypothetical protein
VAIDARLERLRVAVYGEFAATGRPPTIEALAVAIDQPESAVAEGLEALGEAHHLVLRDGQIVLAHPFASTSFGFSVMGERTLYWGGCAWDAFAIPHLVDAEPSVLVATQSRCVLAKSRRASTLESSYRFRLRTRSRCRDMLKTTWHPAIRTSPAMKK